MDIRYAEYLMNASAVLDYLTANHGSLLPRNERVARELTPLLPEPLGMANELAQISKLEKALAEAKTIPEIKTVLDQAAAIAHAAKRWKVDRKVIFEAVWLFIDSYVKLGQVIGPPPGKGGRPGPGKMSPRSDILSRQQVLKARRAAWKVSAKDRAAYMAWLEHHSDGDPAFKDILILSRCPADIQGEAIAELKLRAERKGGKLLKVMDRQPAQRPVKVLQRVTLPELGVSRIQSHRWQALGKLLGPPPGKGKTPPSISDWSDILTAEHARVLRRIEWLIPGRRRRHLRRHPQTGTVYA